MVAVRLIPVFLSALLLGAHFFRMGAIPLVILAVLFPAVLFIRRPWAARLAQIALIAGALEWVRTLLVLIAERQEAGEPWARLAVILGLVAMFTAGSALPFALHGRQPDTDLMDNAHGTGPGPA